MGDEKYLVVKELLKEWDPFDLRKTKKFFFDVADRFNAEFVFIMDIQNAEEVLKVNEKYFFNKGIDKLSYNFELCFSEPFIKEILTDKFTQVINYDIDRKAPALHALGIKVVLAGLVMISKHHDSMLLICTNQETPYEIESKEGLNLKYGPDSTKAFNNVIEEISKRLMLLWTFENNEVCLWKEYLMQLDGAEMLIKISNSIIKEGKIDAALDILERMIQIVRRDFVNKDIDIKKIEDKYSSIAELFEKLVEKEPSMFCGKRYKEKPSSLQISSDFLLAYFLNSFIKEFFLKKKFISKFIPGEG